MLRSGLKRATRALRTGILDRIHRSPLVASQTSVLLENLVASVRGKSVRFRLTPEGKMQAQEGATNVLASDLSRGFWLYRDGLRERSNFLLKSYCLNDVAFSSSDVIFDCGANSGDLFQALLGRITPANYYGFEPNPEDFIVLNENVHADAHTFQIALGSTNTEQPFYVDTTNGDSSLVRPATFSKSISVQVRTLASIIEDFDISAIKLLKLEAEGFEPEILIGLGKKLPRCEYIAIDGGYERGIAREQTLTVCTNFLIANGFDLIDIYFPWHRALFRRRLDKDCGSDAMGAL